MKQEINKIRLVYNRIVETLAGLAIIGLLVLAIRWIIIKII